MQYFTCTVHCKSFYPIKKLFFANNLKQSVILHKFFLVIFIFYRSRASSAS